LAQRLCSVKSSLHFGVTKRFFSWLYTELLHAVHCSLHVILKRCTFSGELVFECVCSAISEDEKEVMRQKLIADFSEPANQVQKIFGNDNFLSSVSRDF